VSGGWGEIPHEVSDLTARREEARRAKDFRAADELRERIRAAGFDVTDGDGGPLLSPRDPPRLRVVRPEDVASRLDEPADSDVSVHWLVEGWPEDVRRGIASFEHHAGGLTTQHVVVHIRGAAEAVAATWPDPVEELRLPEGTGWAAARNAGLTRSLGRMVVVVDGSVELTGPALGSLRDTLADPSVGLTGPFGIATGDLREFHESLGPDVDAIEGYLMAFPRALLVDGLRFDEKFSFYRTADIELSFQVKARGLRTTVTPIPARRHEHRTWVSTPEAERSRLSKRNFYRFLDRWRGRTDLLVHPEEHRHDR
jgi:cysteinyl-tRNA synthetase